MTILETYTCIGLGDLICIKGQTDPFKHQFEQIRITYDPGIINVFKAGDTKYMNFLDEIGKLFFSEPPYVLHKDPSNTRSVDWTRIKGQQGIARHYNVPLVKPSLKHLLCRGNVLNIDEEYIVITTKNRTFTRTYFNSIGHTFWGTMRKLAKKYKIVILGEKVVESSKEYREHGIENTYGIYMDIIQNIPADRVLDLTVPALGITCPNLEQIQQDCMIMSEAKFVVVLGIGGAFCMSTACANVIGHRNDTDGLADELYNNREYPDAFITKNFNAFIARLEKYI